MTTTAGYVIHCLSGIDPIEHIRPKRARKADRCGVRFFPTGHAALYREVLEAMGTPMFVRVQHRVPEKFGAVFVTIAKCEGSHPNAVKVVYHPSGVRGVISTAGAGLGKVAHHWPAPSVNRGVVWLPLEGVAG